MESRFADDLASSSPTPGGGGAAAYCGALAAALASMVGNLTVGKSRYAEVEDDMRRSLARLVALKARLLDLVDEDARAFMPLARTYSMPKDTEEARALRDAAMREALKGACEVPLSIMEACVCVLRECDLMAHFGSHMARSDAGAAAALAKAAAFAASLNVFTNTSSMEGSAEAACFNSRADKLMGQASELGDGIFRYVLEGMRA